MRRSPILFLLLSIPSSYAWPWSSLVSSQKSLNHLERLARADQDILHLLESDPSSLGMSPEESRAIFSSLNLLSPASTKPDCFKTVAARLRSRCSTDVDKGLAEGERIQAAISLTMCDLRSARQTPPLECTTLVPYIETLSTSSRNEFSLDPFDDKQSVYEDPDVEDEKRSRCVEALSRSSQSWSSYSGYIRDFASICHALHRQNNLDTVQTVYRNITAEKVHLLRAMRRGEDERGRAFGMFGQMLGRFEVQLENSNDVAIRLADLESTLTPELFSEAARSALEHLVNELETSSSRKLQESMGVVVEGIRNGLNASVQEHNSHLAHAQEASTQLHAHLSASQTQLMTDLAHAVERRSARFEEIWDDMESRLGGAQQQADLVLAGTSLVSTEASRSLDLVRLSQDASLSHLAQVSSLSSQLSALTEQVNSQLQLLDSAREKMEALEGMAGSMGRRGWEWEVVKRGWVWIAGGDIESIDASAVVQTVGVAFSLAWSIVSNLTGILLASIIFICSAPTRRIRRAIQQPFEKIVAASEDRFDDENKLHPTSPSPHHRFANQAYPPQPPRPNPDLKLPSSPSRSLFDTTFPFPSSRTPSNISDAGPRSHRLTPVGSATLSPPKPALDVPSRASQKRHHHHYRRDLFEARQQTARSSRYDRAQTAPL